MSRRALHSQSDIDSLGVKRTVSHPRRWSEAPVRVRPARVVSLVPAVVPVPVAYIGWLEPGIAPGPSTDYDDVTSTSVYHFDSGFRSVPDGSGMLVSWQAEHAMVVPSGWTTLAGGSVGTLLHWGLCWAVKAPGLDGVFSRFSVDDTSEMFMWAFDTTVPPTVDASTGTSPSASMKTLEAASWQQDVAQVVMAVPHTTGVTWAPSSGPSGAFIVTDAGESGLDMPERADHPRLLSALAYRPGYGLSGSQTKVGTTSTGNADWVSWAAGWASIP